MEKLANEDIKDINEIPIVRIENISPSITKKVIKEGKGKYFVPENGTKILFKCEQRDANGKVLNYANRKVTNSLAVGAANNSQYYEVPLKSMKIHEHSIFSIEKDKEILILIVTIVRIIYQCIIPIDSYTSILKSLTQLKEMCKNYIEIGDEELYRCADTLYTKAIGRLKTIPKKVKEVMTKEENEILNAMILSIHLNKAFTSLKIKNYNAAKEAAEVVLKVDQSNIKAIFRYAVGCYSLKQYQVAFEYFNKVDQIEPHNEALKEYKDFMKRFTKEGAKRLNPLKGFWERYAKEEEDEILNKQMKEKIARKEQRLREEPLNI